MLYLVLCRRGSERTINKERARLTEAEAFPRNGERLVISYEFDAALHPSNVLSSMGNK
jgi:hypothetical protein